jgi:hypothetical protein
MSPKMSKTWEGSMDEDLEKELELEALELVEECARHVIDYEKAKNSKARQTAFDGSLRNLHSIEDVRIFGDFLEGHLFFKRHPFVVQV